MITTSMLQEKIKASPIIIAITNEQMYQAALASDIEIIFLLDANISNLKAKVDLLLENGKLPFIHIDMVYGLSNSTSVVDYVSDLFHNQVGIITTKANLVKRAKQNDLRVIYRVFMVDTKTKHIFIENLKGNLNPDVIEILPAAVTNVIREIKKEFSQMTIVAGGLVTNKKDAYEILKSGADAISTSCMHLIQE